MTAIQPPATPPISEASEQALVDSSVGLKIFAEIMAGIILYGGLGYLADRLLHTSFIVIIGLLLGIGLSMYLVFKRIGGVKA